jgi:hypothetical protein
MRLLILIAVGIFFMLTVFFISWRYIQYDLPQNSPETNELLKYGKEFLTALSRKDGAKIHQMFIPTFQRKYSIAQVQEVIDKWYSGDSYKKARFGMAKIFNLSGHISAWVSFKKNPDTKFIYQYWIKTDNGWKLMWLTGLLNHREFVYGNFDTTAQRIIMKLMLEEALSTNGFEEIFPEIKLKDVIVILLRPNYHYSEFSLPGKQLLWLTEIEIEGKYEKLGIDTYFDFGMVRVMDDIALGALDIVPIVEAVPKPKFKGRKSISMFFKKKANTWEYAGYGSIW